mmetsp:Transcript_2935/g.5408  ORF Transcript_2935/g.5408 Transcript_2935/m.5408 type:complete len:95 (+) Transcript_2935:1029-1313(+)
MSFSSPYFCIFSKLILVSLEYAYLNENSWIGPIPSELGNLEKLDEKTEEFTSLIESLNLELPGFFWLYGAAEAQGTLPTEMGSLTNLECNGSHL